MLRVIRLPYKRDMKTWAFTIACHQIKSYFSGRRSKYSYKNANKRNMFSSSIIPTAIIIFGGTLYFGWYTYNFVKVPHAGVKQLSKVMNVSTESKRVITPEELARHRTLDDGGIWMSFLGKVYDVTDFVESHPGGDKILLAAGGDVSPFWSIYAFHYESHVTEMLKEFYIGDLAVTTPVEDGLSKGPYANEPERHPALLTLSHAPRNAETPPELIPDHPVTPTKLFFVRNHLPVPDIKPEEHELKISSQSLSNNHTKMEVFLKLDTLKKEFPRHKVICTIVCAGNRRSEMAKEDAMEAKTSGRRPIIRGLSWKHSAISTAEWTGVYLRDVLVKYLTPDETTYSDDELLELFKKAGIQHVQFVGADVDPSVGAFGSSLPIDWALDPNKEVLLAFDINGVPLDRDHGAPLRVVVPGSIGARQVKWLTEIILSDEASPSYWFVEDYKIARPKPDGEQTDYKKLPAIMEPPVQSAICNPVDGHTIRNYGEIDVSGYAFSGGGRGIISVTVSIDGGKTWHQAELEPVSPPNVIDPSTLAEGDLALEYRTSRQWAWTLWRVTIAIPDDATELEIICCARDSSNATQPENCKTITNIRGLLMNAWHRIKVKVRPAE
ncbi:Sulfite oxidase mitochondrial [Fasciola gigantica]|uniref:sulfite oxidase n=1 Tax=Fasciola gigantica TaxID=46835 RepID=A0A504ZED8_FASGI|nr:Sulfite oxidase mitochondrial [Fasciola gigantica]